MAHEVRFNVEITQDGQPFFKGGGEWVGVPREDVLAMEGIITEAVQKLQALGKSKLDTGKRK